MRLLVSLFSLFVAGYGLFWIAGNHPDIKTKVEEVLDVGHFHTLEIRYTSSQIMEKHRKELLKDNRHRYLDPLLEFYPYLMMEVKYTLNDNKTHESVVLWDLTDGEMVINLVVTHNFQANFLNTYCT